MNGVDFHGRRDLLVLTPWSVFSLARRLRRVSFPGVNAGLMNTGMTARSILQIVRVALHRVLPELQVLQVDGGAAGDARERILREADVEAGGVADDGGKAAEHAGAAGHGDAVVDQVGGEFGLGKL